MRINVAIPEHEVSKPILDATLEAVTRLDESLLESGTPTFRESVNAVRWAPEPPGQEHFDHAELVLKRGAGDCDDLAPWHAASLRHTGEDPDARAVVKRSGARRWHAVVERGDGSIDDPSLEAGMRSGVPHFGVSGARLPSLGQSNVGSYLEDLPRLAIRPLLNPVSSEIEAWQARADLPWHWSPGDSPTDVAMASLHKSPVASQAIVGALQGVIACGELSELVTPESIDCAHAVAWAAEGADWQDIADEYGEDVADYAFQTISGLFQRMGKGLKKIASPLVKVVTSKAARGIISMIPGVGPVAATALDIASPALNKLASSPDRGGAPKKAAPFGFMKAAKQMQLKPVRDRASRPQATRLVLPDRSELTIRYIP